MIRTTVKKGDMHWEVLIDDVNSKIIKPYNVLAYKEEFIKKLKKSSISKEAFAEKLMREMQYHYWSRCEYEILIGQNEDGSVFLTHLIGNTNDRTIVTNDTGIVWAEFIKTMRDRFSYTIANCEVIKFDIYDQLEFRKQEFIDYCWNFRHKYWRYPKNVIN